mgnify:CR=1 FL=1
MYYCIVLLNVNWYIKFLKKDDFDRLVLANDVVIVEGTLILTNEDLRKKLKIKIFLDTDEDVRLSRIGNFINLYLNSKFIKKCVKDIKMSVKWLRIILFIRKLSLKKLCSL